MQDLHPEVLLKKYRMQRKIGRGFRSIVWQAALHTEESRALACKRILNGFQSRAEAQRTYREVSILEGLKRCSLIVHIHEAIQSSNDRDLYVVMDYMSSDLHAAIRANVLKPVHKELVMWQLLSALKYIHSAGVIHRGLEPQNILLNTRCDIKLCGFSRSRLTSSDSGDDESEMTDYISTRWYRSPEQLISSRNYSTSVDIWAAGCILAELMLLRPLFSGTSTINQLDLILTLTGRPKPDDIKFFHPTAATGFLEGFGRGTAMDIKEVLSNAPLEAQDLIQLMLKILPDMRITATEALDHPFVNHFHNPDDEPESENMVKLSLDCDSQYSVNTYRDFIYADFMGDSRAKTRIRDRKRANLVKEESFHVPNDLKEV